MKRLLLVAATTLLLPIGCGDTTGDAPVPTACPEGNTIGDTCAGVPSEPTADTAACGEVIAVTSSAALGGALSGASSGDCVVLAAGEYGVIVLPDGVSVHGESAESVTVEAIDVTSGTSRIADLTVDMGSVTVRSGAQAALSGTRILNSATDGINLEQGGSATVRSSEIIGAGRYGVSAFDAAVIDLDGTVVADGDGPGLWISCTGGCDCAAPVSSTIKNTVIRNNRIVGISYVGASGTLENVLVADTRVGNSFEAGGGISASSCSDIDASLLTIQSNADFGMLVDDSSLELATATIDDNLRGLWVQAIGASQSNGAVNITDAVLSGNHGVGFGVDNASVNVAIEASQITDTKLVQLPVMVNGVSAQAMDVGDGMSWLGASHVMVTDLALSGNARVGVLINGEVGSGSAIANLSTANMSGTLDIVQQNLPDGGEQPATSGTTPSIESDTAEQFSVPASIAIPPSI